MGLSEDGCVSLGSATPWVKDVWKWYWADYAAPPCSACGCENGADALSDLALSTAGPLAASRSAPITRRPWYAEHYLRCDKVRVVCMPQRLVLRPYARQDKASEPSW